MIDSIIKIVFWMVITLLVVTAVIVNSNERRRQDFVKSTNTTLETIRQAVKDIEKKTNEQHASQDAEFECLINLFITWTNNGQQPINPEDAEDCIAKATLSNPSKATPNATSQTQKTTPPSDSGGGTKKPATKEATEDDEDKVDEGRIPDRIPILGPLL